MKIELVNYNFRNIEIYFLNQNGIRILIDGMFQVLQFVSKHSLYETLLLIMKYYDI